MKILNNLILMMIPIIFIIQFILVINVYINMNKLDKKLDTIKVEYTGDMAMVPMDVLDELN